MADLNITHEQLGQKELAGGVVIWEGKVPKKDENYEKRWKKNNAKMMINKHLICKNNDKYLHFPPRITWAPIIYSNANN